MGLFVRCGFLVVGACFILSGFAFLAGSWHFLRRATRAAGQVVVREEADGDGMVHSYKAVEFRDAAGEPHEALMTAGAAQGLREGDTVAVLYEPHDPDLGRVPSFALLWLAPLIAQGVGVVSAAVGLAALLLR